MKLKAVKKACHTAMAKAAVMANEVNTDYKTEVHVPKGVRVGIALFVALILCLSFSVVSFATVADLTGRVETAGNEVFSFIKTIIVTVGTVSLAACGLVLLLGIGGQRAAEQAKAWIVRILIGLALVLMADTFISWIQSIVQGGGGGGGGGIVT